MKRKAVKTKGKASSKEEALCQRLNRSVFWPLWMVEKLEADVTKAGFRSFSKYIEWIVYEKLGYTEKAYAKKCKEEAQKESKS